MFHPDGYVSLRRVYDLFQNALFDRYWDAFINEAKEASVDFVILEEQSIDGETDVFEEGLFLSLKSGDIGGYLPMLLHTDFPADTIEHIMLREVGSRLYISSPMGQILQIDITWPSGDGFHPEMRWVNFAFDGDGEFRVNRAALRKMQVSNKIYHHSISELQEKLDVPDGEDPISFLKDHMGLICLDHQHSTVSHFYTRDTFCVSLNAYDHVRQYQYIRDYFDRENLAPILRNYEGWALCVKEDFLTEIQEILKTYQSNPSLIRSKGGRKRGKRDLVKISYKKLFPHGHEGLTNDQVISKIGIDIKKKFSLETLNRALGELKEEQA